jgi:lipopolysaccharide transport system permease protein
MTRRPTPSATMVTVRSPRGKRLADIGEIWDYRHLVHTLIWRELKVRYRHTTLGILWFVLQPLLMMLVISIGLRFAVPDTVEGLPYPLYVATGLVLWTYFYNALPTGAGSLEAYRSMLSKISFPRACLPLVFAITAIVDMLAASILLIPMFAYYDILPSWRMVFLPVIILGTACFVYGLALFLSAASARFKDLRQVIPFFTQLMFFGSPVFISQAGFTGTLSTLFMLNPFGTYLICFRWTLVPDAAPPSVLAVQLAAGITALVLVAGLAYFQRQQSTLVDIL